MVSVPKLGHNLGFLIHLPCDDIPPSSVQKQKYLDITFDTKLNWSYHVANVCRNMLYYLTLIKSHVKSLLSHITKMLMEYLVFPCYTYALPL